MEIPSRFNVLSDQEVENLIIMIGEGGKISAIKAIRDVHDLGLKEGKEIVDYLLNTTDWKKYHENKG